MDLSSRFDGSRVVVTGGEGFLGSHLVERLLGLGAHVVSVDNLCTGDAANLAHLADHPRLSVVRADVCAWAGPDGPVDYVLNFACPASPVHYRRLALETLRAGSQGADRLLALAVDRGATLLQASTSEVYGDPAEHPQRETYWGNVNPYGPRSMYDESKRYTEALCAAWEGRGARVRIARIFNTYGPRMGLDDGRAVPNFIAQALRGDEVTVYGDGTQTRSLCFVTDLVEGLLRLAGSEVTGPVNLGNPSEITMRELADEVLAGAGSRSRVTWHPLATDDPVRRRPDITRARTLLGWEPQVALRAGIAATIADFRVRLRAAGAGGSPARPVGALSPRSAP